MSQKLHIALLSTLALAAPTMGTADQTSDLLMFFTDCAGHVQGHLAVQNRSGSGQISEDLLHGIDAIIDSIAPPDANDALKARQDAVRAAHIALLAHAMAEGDLWASRQAAAEVARCSNAVLPS